MNSKKKCLLLVLLLLLFIIPFKVNASSYEIIVDDSANLLSSEEIEKLKNEMIPLSEYSNIGFVTIDNNPYGDTEYYVREYYYKNFGYNDGTIFIIDKDEGYVYIFSRGKNEEIITNGKANIITDNVYKYASDGKYYDCAKETFNQILSLFKGEKIKEPMKYISNAIISLIISSFIGFFISYFFFRVKKSNSVDVIKNSKVSFEVGEVNAKLTGTNKVYSPRSSSSSSSGSFGGFSSHSGGGFSSGGSGGGHRF